METSSLDIEIMEHHWLSGADPEQDLCSHGRVRMRVAGQIVVEPDDGELTLSAAALHLLRTFDRDHGPRGEAGGPLLPCCGFNLIPPADGSEVVMLGCGSWIDWQVTHVGGDVRLHGLHGSLLPQPRTLDAVLPAEAYRAAVLRFVREVWSLFEGAEKRPFDEEQAEGYALFTAEMQRRLER